MMQKTARVSPKNLQFRNSVQIKEIPNNDELFHSVRRASWDPNLNDKDVFKSEPTKARNVIIGFVVCGVVLVLIVIAIILGVIFSQKSTTVADNSVTYNGICTTGSSQCKSSLGLYCPNGFCTCTSPNSWNTATQTCTLLTYNQACTATNQCYTSLGLSCTNQLCQCDIYHSWSSVNNICGLILNNTLTYGNTCAVGSYQCNSAIDLTCTGNCTCLNSKIWNGSSCVCPSGTFLNSSNLCQTVYQYNHTCTVGSNQCDSTKNLSCVSGNCVCDTTQYWSFNLLTCSMRVSYAGFCSIDTDCIPTLICPTVPGVCTCPQYLADYVCNCASTKYYDSIALQCVNRATFNGACTTSANYTCLSTLYCNAGTCACPLGTNWNTTSSICV